MSQPSRRLESIDLLRGVIMIVMALDHVRDFMGMPGINPTDLSQTTVPLFFTRWITHFCAPVFFLLTGTGAFLSRSKRSTADLSRFLVTRGLWLIVLEITFVRCLGFQFNFDYHVTMLNVLWALGWAMISLSALVWLPAWLVTTIGAVMIAGHNLLDGVQSASPVWMMLHQPGFLLQGPDPTVFVAYPIIPWIGVTAVGYGLGQVYGWSTERRTALLWRLGLGLTAAFFVIRGLNIYGDPVAWSAQATSAMTAVSFLDTNKYPPSLLFLLMTLGPALLFLAAADRGTPKLLRPAVVYGKVPLFYFVLHLPLIHLVAVALCYRFNGGIHWLFESPDLGHFPFTTPPVWGISLPMIYLVWAGVVISLYPAVKWYSELKGRSRNPLLSYL